MLYFSYDVIIDVTLAHYDRIRCRQPDIYHPISVQSFLYLFIGID